MTMVTINDTEYNTDDFTEDQKVLYNEILFATNDKLVTLLTEFCQFFV